MATKTFPTKRGATICTLGIRVPGATHMAKHTRGLVARHLCECGVDVRSARALQDIVGERFETTLNKPARPGQPWVLDTRPR